MRWLDVLDIIEPAQTKWALPIVFASKMDGTLQFCVDYRIWNAVNADDCYPILSIDVCIDSLFDLANFSKLEASSSYLQVQRAKGDKPETAFCFTSGIISVHFHAGLIENAPGTFPRAMDVILFTVHWKLEFVYQNEIVKFSKSLEAKINYLRPVLKRLLQHLHHFIELKKYELFSDAINYPGLVICTGQLAVSQ